MEKTRKKKIKRLPVILVNLVFDSLYAQGGNQGYHYFVRLEKIAELIGYRNENDKCPGVLGKDNMRQYHYFRIAADFKKLTDLGVFVRRKEGQYSLNKKLFELICAEVRKGSFPYERISDLLHKKEM